LSYSSKSENSHILNIKSNNLARQDLSSVNIYTRVQVLSVKLPSKLSNKFNIFYVIEIV